MPIKIQRMLDGAYHLRVGSEEFMLTKRDLKMIADQAIADGIVGSAGHGVSAPHQYERVSIAHNAVAGGRTLAGPYIIAIASIGVLIGLSEMPYGYYQLLRLFLCGTSVYYLAERTAALSDGNKLALGGLAVLYNPIFPIHLGDKGLWSVINIGTVIYFAVLSFRRRS